jgi:hypothetical protein
MRSSLPTVGFIRLNEGSLRSKSTTRQTVDSMGMVGGLSEVDVKFKKVFSDFEAHRWNEDQTFLESISQKISSTIFTGNEASDDTSFTGFQPRFAPGASSLVAPTLGTAAYQIVDGGGTGTDNTSVWVVDWGERACHLIHPEGDDGGIEQTDHGPLKVETGSGATARAFFAATTEFNITCGLSIHNLRHVCRIANIDKSDVLSTTEATNPNIIKLLAKAMHKMLPQNGARRCIYCSRDIATLLDIQANNKSNLALSQGEWAGVPATMYRGAPIRETDALGADEARVT